MLEAVRNFTTSPIGKVVLVVVLLTFAGGLWYVGDPMATGGGDWALKVGDQPIPADTVRIDYQRELEFMRQETGETITPEAARELGLHQRVINTLVTTSLLDLAARELGLIASDDLVRQTILNNPRFHGPDGTFDREVYGQTLALNGFTESRYEQAVRSEIVRRQLLSGLQSGAIAPPALTNLYYRVAAERRVIEYIPLEAEDPDSLPEPEEAALREVYEDRSALFSAPEYRTLTVVEIRVDDLAAEVAVSDAEVANAFEDRAGEFTTPEKRTVRQIVVQDEATAGRIHERLQQGADFASVAAEEAGLTPELLSLGTVERGEMVPEIGTAAFALEEGGISEPVETLFGWTIVTVDAIEPAEVRPLEDVAEQLQTDLAREKATEGVYDLAARLQDSLAAGSSLEDAAAALNLRLRQIPAVDGTGMDRSGKAIADLPPEIVRVAFQTAEGQESPLTDMGDTGSFIVRVDRINPRAPRPFAEVRDQAETLVRQQRAKTASREIADAIAEEIRAGAGFAAVAAKRGLTAEVSDPIDRNGNDTRLPRLIVEIFFDKPRGEVLVIPLGQNHVVGRVREVVSAPPETANPATIAALRDTLTEQLRGELAEQLVAALRRRNPVQVNEAVLNEQF